MQWTNAVFAGFSSAQPWLKVHPDYVHRNVLAQQADPNSLWNFTRRLITLRRTHPALRQGTFRVIFRADTGVLGYERTLADIAGKPQRILVYMNFTGQPALISFVPDASPETATILLGNASRQRFLAPNQQFELYPYEVLLLEVKSAAV
ncbi:MAG: DUF3459 domain-containing protein [Chloroflexi bacterium]|nr:DUF3459 domain-containing protein [Chloroflexota bacterium]